MGEGGFLFVELLAQSFDAIFMTRDLVSFLVLGTGLGQPDVDCLRRIHDHYSTVAPKAIAVTFGSAFFAQIRGDFDQAISHYEEFVTGQSIVKTFHNLSYWQQIWLYA